MKNIALDARDMNPFIRFVINVNPKNTRSKPARIRNAPINGLKTSNDFFPGKVKSLQAYGPEIKTFAWQFVSDVT
jgi:hypothetical protein